MLAGILVAAMVVTGALLWRAKQAWLEGDHGTARNRVVLALPIFAAVCAAVWLAATRSGLLRWEPPNGFGPGWHCNEYGVLGGATVCFR